MTNDCSDLPIFPISAPAVFCDPDITPDLFTEVLQRLAEVVDIDHYQLDAPTPCRGLNVGELRSHILGWLEFFAAALSDPVATNPRPDPESFVLANNTKASDIVLGALADIRTAIAADAAGGLVSMSSARMAGDGVLGMALGEYIIHAWDLSSATGRSYSAPDSVVEPAHEFLAGMVAPESSMTALAIRAAAADGA